MAMSPPDVFDPTRPVTAETVNGLTMPELIKRLNLLNQQVGNTQAATDIVARTPSVKGILSVLDAGRGQTNELRIILDSIQHRAEQVSLEIDDLKKEI